ncbi:hypothetical protein E2C01_079706 [Portunus trituberculatus]|uniref:Uncharacterized protein n=1 Tax=Portunus trituberculatus TaxID=210409 RepID=A0A5B7IM67_PORTR|nr:hypothetical protein [Portunus trituberculatus]
MTRRHIRQPLSWPETLAATAASHRIPAAATDSLQEVSLFCRPSTPRTVSTAGSDTLMQVDGCRGGGCF